MNSNEQGIRRFAAVAIAMVGVLHLVLAKEYLEEETYIGVLFIAGGVAAVVVAVRLWMAPDRLAWGIGALVAAGMFVGFVLSRTTGLPGFKESEWELSGIVSLLLEAAFLGAFAAWTRAVSRRTTAATGGPAGVPFYRATEGDIRSEMGTRDA
jgi:hypothetical protein